MRVVLDTNVLASALLSPNGAPAAMLPRVLAGQVVLCFDARVLSEYREILCRPEFDPDARFDDDLLEHLEAEGELVASVPRLLSLPDPDDATFLEVAAADGSDHVVIGNLRYFPTRARRGVSVASPRDSLESVVGE